MINKLKKESLDDIIGGIIVEVEVKDNRLYSIKSDHNDFFLMKFDNTALDIARPAVFSFDKAVKVDKIINHSNKNAGRFYITLKGEIKPTGY